jgi:hypothetical protein
MRTPSPQQWPPASDAVSVRSVSLLVPASQRLTKSASSPLQFRRLAVRSRCPCELSALRLECPKTASTHPAAEIEEVARCRVLGLATTTDLQLSPHGLVRQTLTSDDHGWARNG